MEFEHTHVVFGLVFGIVLLTSGVLAAAMPKEELSGTVILAPAKPAVAVVCTDRDALSESPINRRSYVTARFSDATSDLQTDSCYSATAVNEKVCDVDRRIGTIVTECAFPKPVCENGACVATTMSCTDSDAADDAYEQGVVSIQYRKVNPENPNFIGRARKAYYDSCSPDGMLVQVSCPTTPQLSGDLSEPHVGTTSISCPAGMVCKDGACT